MNHTSERWAGFAILSIAFGCNTVLLSSGSPTFNRTRARLSEAYGQLPLSFERNEGQTDKHVEFVSRGRGYTMFLSRGGEAVLVLTGSETSSSNPRGRHRVGATNRAHVSAAIPPGLLDKDRNGRGDKGAALRLKLVGANGNARARGRDELAGKVNYLRGKDPERWRSDIATFAKVAYDEIYPGVDLVYYGNQRQLEYDFIVRPGADPRVITLEVEGADKLEISHSGDLVVHVAGRQVLQRKPVVYQDVDGDRQRIDGRYELRGSRRVTFELTRYDRSLPLVIDPVLLYSTYLGGGQQPVGYDVGIPITVDGTGSAYVTGYTGSEDFPATVGAYDTSWNAGSDAFVAKLDPTGATLVYSTFLGGSSDDYGFGIAVDGTGAAYVTGYTFSSDFPTTPGAYDTSWNTGFDAFVAKLDPTGGALAYSTYLGGNSSDISQGVTVDLTGAAYVTGYTLSGNFPTTPGADDTSWNGSADVFVTKLDPTGGALVYSTFLGGNSDDVGHGVAVDGIGAAYVTGYTLSSNFPATLRAYDTSWNGSYDVFVTKVDPIGATLAYSTFLGGTSHEEGHGVAFDRTGAAYVAGFTFSSNFPTTPGAYDTSWNGNYDVFVTKLDPTGEAVAYSTFLGGSVDDFGHGIAVDAAGNASVTGFTLSSNFPTTSGAHDTSWNNSYDAFVTKVNPTGAALAYSTYLGGTNLDIGQGVAVDTTGNIYVTGYTDSSDFPTTAGAYDTSYNGLLDVFVTKIGDISPPATLVLSPTAVTNTVASPHCVTATVRDVFGNPTPNIVVRFTVAGSVNTNGSATTNATGQASFCYQGPGLPGGDVITAYADSDNDNTRDAGEPAGTATKTWVLPPSTPGCGDVEGHGFISVAGGWAVFTFEVEQDATVSTPEGQLAYYDRSAGKRFRATGILALIITGSQATIFGQGREDNGPTVPFRVDVTDARPDTFQIVWPGYTAHGTVYGDIEIDRDCDD